MSEKFDSLDSRLKKADPATDAPAIGADILVRATNAKPRKSAAFRLGSFAVGLSGLAATVAIALTLSTPTQPLFELGAATGNQSASKVAGSSAGVADMGLRPFIQYEWVAGSGLSGSEQSGMVYQVVPSPYIESWIANLAVELAVAGSAKKVDGGSGTDFIIGGDADGLKPSIYYSTANGSYYYSNQAAYGTWTCDANKENCVQKAVPSNLVTPLPSKQEAIDTALSLGLADANMTRWDFVSDGTYANLTGYEQINGIDGLALTLNWAQSGMLAGIQGMYVDIHGHGPLSTISAAKAVERLNDYRWGAALPASFYGEPQFYSNTFRMGLDDTMVGSGIATAVSAGGSEPASSPTDLPTAVPDVTATPGEVTAEPVPIEPGTPEPMPTPSIEKVEIVKATLTMVSVWDAKGNLWLVPGYALYADKGLVGGVIALHEGVIKLPEVMPMVK